MFCLRGLPKLASFVLWAAWQAKSAVARSWIDCIDHNYDAVYTKSEDWVRGGTNGQGACEGYAYNYPGRGEGSVDIDFSWRIDAAKLKDDNTRICQCKQSDATYNEWRRTIHAKPGDKLYLGYMSNGHIIRDKQGTKSTWGVYWSGVAGRELTKPSELTRQRLVDGKLNDFDDGNCGMTYTNDAKQSGRAGDNKPCAGSFSIPSTAKPGRYQMVWYWTVFEHDGDETLKNGAAYTSCFDVVVDDPHHSVDGNGLKAPELCDIDKDIYTPARVSAHNDPNAVPPTTPAPTSTTPAPSVHTPTPTIPTPTVPAKAPSSARLAKSFSTAGKTIVSPFFAPLVAVTYNGVGGSGLYGKVTAMQCPGNNTCTHSGFAVSGPIAPFDEDLTLALRGPLDVDNIAIFTSSDATTWAQASAYSKQAGTSNNIVFLNNKGDPLKSGVFDLCDGNSQSYATADGKRPATAVTPFGGLLADDVEVNVMSSTNCALSGTCGVSRGVAHEGWKGNNKIFMIKATMPNAPPGGKNLPAIWLLNGQIVRTAQYGCNCRGKGVSGTWKGGCGEFDVAEVLSADPTSLTSTIYSFKGSRGTDDYAQRPDDAAVVFVVILTQQTTTGSTNLGMAQVLLMNPEDVDMTTPPSNADVQQWLSYRNGVQVDFDI